MADYKASRRRSFGQNEVRDVLCDLFGFDKERTNLVIEGTFIVLAERYELRKADDGRFDVV